MLGAKNELSGIARNGTGIRIGAAAEATRRFAKRSEQEAVMGFYKILSTPVFERAAANYKGLYRSEPFPEPDADAEIISLWQQYTSYLEPMKNMGITDELALSELKRLAALANQNSDEFYEVVYFSEEKDCRHKANYYGIDVTGKGGYSLIGDGTFANDYLHKNDTRRFRVRLNEDGLFNTRKDAANFLDALNGLKQSRPGELEDEEWRIVHVFGVQ